MEAMKQCVAYGLGIRLMPYVSVEALLRDQKLKIIESSDRELVLPAVSIPPEHTAGK